PVAVTQLGPDDRVEARVPQPLPRVHGGVGDGVPMPVDLPPVGLHDRPHPIAAVARYGDLGRCAHATGPLGKGTTAVHGPLASTHPVRSTASDPPAAHPCPPAPSSRSASARPTACR